ncbi:MULTISPECIES: GNAT family N-acetyltransferase [unclassified Saccharopolyspora]|uniref:GNAT family N-acetyltransferase n=1 Tax=Saccharopolyspora TaxID=1835 RepID=UPI00190A5C64|nr:GNAT family N-acetyltransferase [Saccharopolyspora sp. HNM0986]MBK0869743.1 GNAT family N-acetyltransferase [Saccharopolyspora sp. HNM0986]
MTITVRRSGPADRPAILSLLDAARGDELSAAQRAERGFVQGTLDEQLLARFQADLGVFVAEDGGVLAGFAMTTEPDVVTGGPPVPTVATARQNLAASTRFFLYGPAAVDRRFQGRGVLTMLLAGLSRELSGRFDRGVAFVQAANEKSLAVHRHYGMSEIGRFDHRGSDYRVFAFDPAKFATR